jgi:hypothetical protein
MENNFIIQTIRASVKDVFSSAEKYYSVLSAVNDLKLTQREIQLVAFTAIKGNMSYANFREEFCERYATTSPTINNIISKLKRKRVLVKINGKVKVNPVIVVDFEKSIKLEIKIAHEK